MHQKPNRRSIRLPEYDYSQAGAYFVTICVLGKIHRLGEVIDGEMNLNKLGEVADMGWRWLTERADLPVSCVMPNHVHAIVVLPDTGRGGVTPPLRKPTLGQVVAYYKYATTKVINQIQNAPGVRFWQRNYYERVIRNQREFDAVAEYIQANPLNWEQDEYR